MKLLAIALVTLATAAAYAKSNTEYYYQPAAGQSSVELKYDMDSMPMDGTKVTRNDVWARYLYGLNETNTLGIYLASGDLKTAPDAGTSTTQSGMTDLHPFWEAYSGMWHYGVDLGINTAKAKPDNRASGGLSARAHVGVLMSSNAWNYGADLSYLMPLERQYDNGALGSGKLTDGGLAKLDLFGEYNYGMGFVGLDLSYNMLADTTVKPDAGGTSKTKGEGFMGLGLNGSYDFNDMWTGLLTVAMNSHTDHDATDAAVPAKVKAYTETEVLVGVRASF